MKDKNLSKRFRPCMLVSFFSHAHRAFDYRVEDKQASTLADGSEISSWKTTKIVLDPENARKASNLRLRFIHAVTKLGVQYGNEKLVFVDFERRDDLDAMVKVWEAEVEEFNAQSPLVKVDFGVLPPLDLTGSNEYFMGKLVDEMRDTMGEMKDALQAADYKKVRSVVAKLKGFTALVADDNQAVAIQSAINDARKQARMIKKELEKRGTSIEQVQAMISTSTVDLAASVTLLDDDEVDAASANELVAALAEQQSAAIDFEDEDEDEGVEAADVVAEAPLADSAEENEEGDAESTTLPLTSLVSRIDSND